MPCIRVEVTGNHMACPICGNRQAWSIPCAHEPRITDWRAQTGDTVSYEWRLCRRCGNAYPSYPPALDVLQNLWKSNRTDVDSTAAERAERWSYRRAVAKTGAHRSYRFFAPLAGKTKGRFIDVACGLGETVRLFASRGWFAEGIDADPSTEPIHRELGIQTRIGQFEELEIGTEYDIIHISHAIYFITDPMRFIRTVRRRLAPDGLFCIVLADFFAHADRGLPCYLHTYFPTARSMRYALALAGFKTVLCKRRSGSIYIAAQPSANPGIPFVSPTAILALYRTKPLRYRLLGRPYLALRTAIKRLLVQ